MSMTTLYKNTSTYIFHHWGGITPLLCKSPV